jgi:hypothetical protein
MMSNPGTSWETNKLVRITLSQLHIHDVHVGAVKAEGVMGQGHHVVLEQSLQKVEKTQSQLGPLHTRLHQNRLKSRVAVRTAQAHTRTNSFENNLTQKTRKNLALRKIARHNTCTVPKVAASRAVEFADNAADQVPASFMAGRLVTASISASRRS